MLGYKHRKFIQDWNKIIIICTQLDCLDPNNQTKTETLEKLETGWTNKFYNCQREQKKQCVVNVNGLDKLEFSKEHKQYKRKSEPEN